MTTDLERLLAEGEEVTLADGPHRLVFDYRALAWLQSEQKWGLSEISRRLQWQDDSLLPDLGAFLTAGLRHEGTTGPEVEAGVLLSELKNYQRAIVQAIDAAFPEPEPEPEGNGVGPATTSTGPTSTTSPPSSSDELVTSSGA